ncbi:MAG: L,D-transpeptidase family protein [Sphingomicrobium sp.]
MCAAAAGLILAAAPLAPAQAATAAAAPRAAAKPASAAQTIDDFYRARAGALLWLSPSAGDSAQQLLAALSNARVDGLDPDRYQVSLLSDVVRKSWGGDRKALERADRQLSQAFVAYVQDLRRDPGIGVMYVDAAVRPTPPSALAALLEAAMAPSLPAYVKSMGWMNPVYGQLRQALLTHNYASEHERQLLALNLERARTLPSGPGGRGRFVMVNAAQQRLFMWENGRIVDSMRVVVGKPKYPTPMMSALIRFASLNPYWYVPPDLAAERIAPNVLKRGLGYLDELGYQVMSDWSPNSTIIDPKTIDWQAVADGKTEVLIRQLPGAHNSMGRMKFMFPNAAGVYLHDNPERELFEQAARLYSGGCVRLEDAARLGRWLFGRELEWEGAGTEEAVPLTTPVPVYITYLTAMPDGSSIAYYDDVYGRDAARLATLSSATPLAGR